MIPSGHLLQWIYFIAFNFFYYYLLHLRFPTLAVSGLGFFKFDSRSKQDPNLRKLASRRSHREYICIFVLIWSAFWVKIVYLCVWIANIKYQKKDQFIPILIFFLHKNIVWPHSYFFPWIYSVWWLNKFHLITQ